MVSHRITDTNCLYLLITTFYNFSDYNRNFTNVNQAIEIAAAGPKVYEAIWLLILAMIVKLVSSKIKVEASRGALTFR